MKHCMRSGDNAADWSNVATDVQRMSNRPAGPILVAGAHVRLIQGADGLRRARGPSQLQSSSAGKLQGRNWTLAAQAHWRAPMLNSA